MQLTSTVRFFVPVLYLHFTCVFFINNLKTQFKVRVLGCSKNWSLCDLSWKSRMTGGFYVLNLDPSLFHFLAGQKWKLPDKLPSWFMKHCKQLQRGLFKSIITWLICFINTFLLPFQRGDDIPKVLVFSVEGYFLYSWNDTVEMPHGIFVLNTATDSSVWITDVGSGKHGGDVGSIKQGRKCKSCINYFKQLIYLSKAFR